MTMSCKVCSHPDRKKIDRELLAGASQSDIARRYGISKDSVHRHYRDHIGPAAVAGQRRAAENHGARLLEDLDELVLTARRILRQAEEEGNSKTALLALKESRASLVAIAQVSHALFQAQQSQLITVEAQENDPEFALFYEGFKQLPKRRQKQYMDIVIEAISLSNGTGDAQSDEMRSFPFPVSAEGEKRRTTPLVSSQNDDSELVVDPSDSSLKPRTIPRRKKDPDSDKPQMRRTRPPRPNRSGD